MLTALTTDSLITLHSHAGSLLDTVLVRRLLSTLTHTRSSRTTVSMRSRDATTPPAEPATQEHAQADTRTADVTMVMDMNMIHAHTETANM